MRRPFVFSTLAVAPALLAAVLYAQTPNAQTPPAGQTPAAPAQPTAPALSFSGSAGMLLMQVKPDQTAAFEEMMAKIKSVVASTDKAEVKQVSFKTYKAAEAMGGNTLYVLIVDPAIPNQEYAFLQVINKTLTDDQKRLPETQEMFKRFAAAIANTNKLNLTPVGQ